MTPKAIATHKSPAFFECHKDQVFYVDKDGLDSQVAKLLSSLGGNFRGGELAPFLKLIQGQDIGNEYYKVDPKYLLVGVMALEAREGGRGETANQLEATNSKLRAALAQIDPQNQYVAFLVRDDSFNVFRKAREFTDRQGYDTGWELLGSDEPIKFGQGTAIMPQ